MPETTEGVRRRSGYGEAESRVFNAAALEQSKNIVEALRHSKIYREYERSFIEATGLPLGLRPVEFFGLPLHGKKNENPFCAFLAERKDCCALCLRAQACLTQSCNANPHSVRCAYGLTETVVPVLLGERVIGYLCTGQVFTHAIKPEALEETAMSAKGRQLWKNTPFIEPAKYKAMVRLLSFFARQLSALSNQLFIEQKSREPEVVSRARRFISEHKQGRITLAAVAQASGASMFHFCKLFRATTGVKFTEYVARSRVEAARDLLRDPRMRMCEVAYESGFQSLTAFHRAFQRVLGQSPSEYRSALVKDSRRLRSS